MDKNLKPAEMPDVAADAKVQVAGRLDWVGMNSIELPVFLDGGDGERMQTSARVGAFVNLGRPDKRGIHMSRLYLHLHEALADHTDRKSTRLNSSHVAISYAVFCLKHKI